MGLSHFSRQILMAFLCLILASSCVSRKRVVYFQDIEYLRGQATTEQNNIKIKPDDEITIRVSAPEPEAALPFNLTQNIGGAGAGGAGGGGGNAQLETYLVSDEGEIQFPVIGTVEVEGLTNLELAEKLEEEISRFVNDPIITVRVVNFQITLLGEVNGTFRIEDDHINLSQALGLAGGIPLSGKLDNILVMREENGVRKHAYLDITDAEVLNSPFYNLKQNDVVYVEPTGARRQAAGNLGTIGTYVGVFSGIISLVLIFTRT